MSLKPAVLPFLKNHRQYLLLVLVGLVVAGAAITASSIAKTSSSGTQRPIQPTTFSNQPIGPPAKLEAERLTLKPSGFEPGEITRPAGRFLLAVNDRSGQEGIAFVLSRQNGERVHEVRMRDTGRKHEWRRVVNLPPGSYLLSEANHPEWVCRITITAN